MRMIANSEENLATMLHSGEPSVVELVYRKLGSLKVRMYCNRKLFNQRFYTVHLNISEQYRTVQTFRGLCRLLDYPCISVTIS